MLRRFCALCSLTLIGLAALLPPPTSAQEPEVGVVRPSNFWDIDIWSDPDRGFLFYEPQRPRKPAQKADPKQSPPPGRRALALIKDHDELKKEREARLKLAIMQPTAENMKAYLEANTFVMQKSAMFSDMWRRTVWQNSEFDFNVQNPQANFAQTAIRLDRDARKKQVVADLSRDYGILFFGRSDCPYCKLQAPVLREFARQYGIDVMAITLDGKPLEGFPDARPDNGISFRVSSGQGIGYVPALYLVARNSPEAISLGAGVMAMDEIVERINVLTQLPPGTDVAGGVR